MNCQNTIITTVLENSCWCGVFRKIVSCDHDIEGAKAFTSILFTPYPLSTLVHSRKCALGMVNSSTLSYFPPDTTGAPPVTPTVLLEIDFKDFLVDGNISQAYKENICRKTKYSILRHPISDILDYLHNVESGYANST